MSLVAGGGQQQPETLLLLHGNPTWSFLYRHVIPHLTGAGFRVLALDFAGFGRSDKPLQVRCSCLYVCIRLARWSCCGKRPFAAGDFGGLSFTSWSPGLTGCGLRGKQLQVRGSDRVGQGSAEAGFGVLVLEFAVFVCSEKPLQMRYVSLSLGWHAARHCMLG